MQNITIQGARVHNLKNINLSIPKNKLIVATGISGSGKSSLVFDIIFEEGRKQYLQSLGILTGFENEEKFERISGLGPTIAVQQNNIRQSNPRSTVGSRTNLLNLLALLYASEGHIDCAACGTPVGEDLLCPACGRVEERLLPAYFVYSSPNGMCMRCLGRGFTDEIRLEKLAPSLQTTLETVFDQLGMTPGYVRLFKRKYAPYLNQPFWGLPPAVRDEVLYGHSLSSQTGQRSSSVRRILQARLFRGEDLGGLYERIPCPDCGGSRVGPEARRVLLKGRHIGQLGQMTISELQAVLEDLTGEAALAPFGKNLLRDILAKTRQLIRFRLGHLSLYREMPSLSGGEIQRLFLNAHLDSGLDSLIYVLDEPTVGLHESEKAELLRSIWQLKEMGNTVIVVEHDRSTIQMAEHIIDLGPKAGVEGGQVVYQGDVAGLLACPDSITGAYLAGRAQMPQRARRMGLEAGPHLTLRHAKTNNLKDVTVSFPLGCMVGVAGVSGSGKSSLIADTLLPLLQGALDGAVHEAEEGAEWDNEEEPILAQTAASGLEGLEYLSGFAGISQAPIGRNMNSTPISYIGIWDKIRALFARQPLAVEQGLSAGHFSFNSKGACSTCGGSGVEKIWLGGDLKMDKVCSECHGRRYNAEALSVEVMGKTIHQVLEMSVSEALDFFAADKGISAPLRVLERIGMGYIRLGQPTPTISGGEAQRIKLAKEIGRRRKGSLLYVLDEPTTGLSLYDTARLIELLDELVTNGHSVIVIEHNPDVLAVCDWIIELGPGSGAEGGQLWAEGSPEALKQNLASITGRYLP